MAMARGLHRAYQLLSHRSGHASTAKWWFKASGRRTFASEGAEEGEPLPAPFVKPEPPEESLPPLPTHRGMEEFYVRVARTFDPTYLPPENFREIQAEIFDYHIGDGRRSGRKMLSKKLIGEKVDNYYMEPISKLDPLFDDPVQKRRKIKLERMKRRGKAAPKKGEGKRSKK